MQRMIEMTFEDQDSLNIRADSKFCLQCIETTPK